MPRAASNPELPCSLQRVPELPKNSSTAPNRHPVRQSDRVRQTPTMPSFGEPNRTRNRPAARGAGLSIRPGRSLIPNSVRSGRPDLTRPDLTRPDLTKTRLGRPDLPIAPATSLTVD